MAAERKDESLELRPGPALSEFIKEAKEKALEAGQDPEVETLRILLDASKSGKVRELIQLDLKDVGKSSTSSN